MDILFEALIDLILEGAIEGSKSNKIPKPIRIILILFLSLFYLTIIGVVLLVGILMLKEKNYLGGIIVSLLAFLLLVACIARFRKAYLEKKNNKVK